VAIRSRPVGLATLCSTGTLLRTVSLNSLTISSRILDARSTTATASTGSSPSSYAKSRVGRRRALARSVVGARTRPRLLLPPAPARSVCVSYTRLPAPRCGAHARGGTPTHTRICQSPAATSKNGESVDRAGCGGDGVPTECAGTGATACRCPPSLPSLLHPGALTRSRGLHCVNRQTRPVSVAVWMRVRQFVLVRAVSLWSVFPRISLQIRVPARQRHRPDGIRRITTARACSACHTRSPRVWLACSEERLEDEPPPPPRRV
jgi:hypothetical protein